MVLSAIGLGASFAIAAMVSESKQMPFVLLTLFCHAILIFSISLGNKKERGLE